MLEDAQTDDPAGPSGRPDFPEIELSRVCSQTGRRATSKGRSAVRVPSELPRARPARSMAILAMTGHGQDARATSPRRGGMPVPLLRDLSRDLCISAKESDRFLSMVAELAKIRVNNVYLTGHFVMVSFVFIHIPGGCCTF